MTDKERKMLAALRAAAYTLLACADGKDREDNYWNAGGEGYSAYLQVTTAIDDAEEDN